MKYTIDNPKIVKWFDKLEEDNFTGVVKDEDGTIAYYENGLYHRTDGPAIVWSNGNAEWCINGKTHREDGPAVELANGNRCWCYNGKCHGYNNDFTVESWKKKCNLEIFK